MSYCHIVHLTQKHDQDASRTIITPSYYLRSLTVCYYSPGGLLIFNYFDSVIPASFQKSSRST